MTTRPVRSLRFASLEPRDVASVAQALIEALELELADAKREADRLRRDVERLELELDDRETIATVMHRFVDAWDDSGEVRVVAATTSRADTYRADMIRACVSMLRHYCAAHPERETLSRSSEYEEE